MVHLFEYYFGSSMCVYSGKRESYNTIHWNCLVFFYAAISYNQKYYGESILFLMIMLPMYIYGVIHWLRNRDQAENVVLVRSNLSKKEWSISFICFTFLSVISYFILKLLKTSKLNKLLNALSY